MVNWKKLFADLFIGLVLAFMYLPLLFVIVYSFSGNSRFVFDSFTFDSYVTLFTNPPAALINALKNTLIIAAISSVISTFMGTCAAIGIFHMSKKARRVVERKSASRHQFRNSNGGFAASVFQRDKASRRLRPAYNSSYGFLYSLRSSVGYAQARADGSQRL